jgi:hypothetical protein
MAREGLNPSPKMLLPPDQGARRGISCALPLGQSGIDLLDTRISIVDPQTHDHCRPCRCYRCATYATACCLASSAVVSCSIIGSVTGVPLKHPLR